jgi:glycosyltransferase involved in cell wall biosynthesis
MKILAFTAGAAQMYCGSCLRDNTLAAELKRLGHDILLMPLYTPTRTDEANVSDSRIFMNGITVCLEQESAFFRKTRWLLDRVWDAPWMIRLASKTSIAVDARVLGEMTVSVLKGEKGYQLKDIRKLTAWLANETPPDVVTLPNSMLSGLAKPIRDVMRRPVCCTLQGDELFLDQLKEPYRSEAWDLVRANVQHVDAYIAVSEYAAQFWRAKLGLGPDRVRAVPLGIAVEEFKPRPAPSDKYTLGFFARIAPEKGLHLLADAYIQLRRAGELPRAELLAAGYLAPEHKQYLRDIEQRMESAGLSAEFRYLGQMDRAGKLDFLRRMHVQCVPFTYDEPKGLSILEAMSVGTPVVAPRRGSITEMVEKTGGGILVEPDDVASIASAVLTLSKDRSYAIELGRHGVKGVRQHYNVTRMASLAVDTYRAITHKAAVHA